MLPNYGFDWPPVPDTIEVPLRKGNLRIDYAYGAPTIGAAPTVARNTLWSFRYASGVLYGKPGTGAEIALLTIANILEFGICFDEDMQPVIAYSLTTGGSFYRIYDQATKAFIVNPLPQGATSPRAVYDLKALSAAGTAEVIIGYMVGKDIYVLQSSKGYSSPRLAATYLQDLSLDQISFAANNRLRFIMYQLTNPEHLPNVEPVPQSKYSCFLYRRKYTGSNPPVLNDDVATFSSSGLKYTLTIRDTNPAAPDVRTYPLSICLRPEWVDELIAKNQKDKPIFRISKTYSEGMDTEATVTLNQLTQMGGMVYDPTIKLYRCTFDHLTEGKYNRSIIIKFTDLIVGETTLLIIDEALKLPDLDDGMFVMKPIFPEIAPIMAANGYPLTDAQYQMVYHNENGAKFVIDDTDPSRWNTYDPNNENKYSLLYLPYVVGIDKTFVDTKVNPTDLVFTMSSAEPGSQPAVMRVTKAILNQLILANTIVLKNNYYYVAVPLGVSNPELSIGSSWTYTAADDEGTQFAMITDIDVEFSQVRLKYIRPSKIVSITAPLVPETSAVDTLTEVTYKYQFNADNAGTGQRYMVSDVYLPRSFFWDISNPKGYQWTMETWKGNDYTKTESSWDRGMDPNIQHAIKDNCYVFSPQISEVAKELAPNKYRMTFRRLHDGKSLTIDMIYERLPNT